MAVVTVRPVIFPNTITVVRVVAVIAPGIVPIIVAVVAPVITTIVAVVGTIVMSVLRVASLRVIAIAMIRRVRHRDRAGEKRHDQSGSDYMLHTLLLKASWLFKLCEKHTEERLTAPLTGFFSGRSD
jgi:hypothetical protein